MNGVDRPNSTQTNSSIRRRTSPSQHANIIDKPIDQILEAIRLTGHNEISMLQNNISIEFDLELVLLILQLRRRPRHTTTIALRDLGQIDLVKPVRIAQTIFIPIGLSLAIRHMTVYDLLGRPFPVPF